MHTHGGLGTGLCPIPTVMSPGGALRRKIEVKTGEFSAAGGACLLLTRGVGSCVVACLWDSGQKVGGMAHVPQPCSDPTEWEATIRPGLFADTALAGLFRLMQARGARRERVSVRLAGAGNMFAGIDGGFMGDIATGVLEGVNAAVRSLGLFVAARSVGGMYGRSVFFNVATGLIEVRLTNGEHVAL